MKQLKTFLGTLVLFVLTFSSNVKAQYFVAPIGSNPDPYIIYDNGWYYYTGTSGNGVYLKKARTLEGLKHTTMTKMFGPENGGPCCDYWAPELHKINNIWYIYYTARDPIQNGQRTFVLENTNSDPMAGSWTNKGKIYDAWADNWAIDGTILETGGQRYFIWSGVAQPSDGDKPQRLYIARMTNAWTLQPGRVLLSSPTLSWELNGSVNEGPAVIVHGGKIFLTYSANGCWTSDYLIAGLYMTEGADPMNAASWTKMANPLFKSFAQRDMYSPGHHIFFTSPDGTETWFSYHATPNAAGGCDDNRTTRAQKVFWDANGFPFLGLGDPTGAYLTAPGGEPALPIGPTLPNGIYKITPTSSNKPLDVNGCSPMPGTKVQQWTDNGNDCQKWHIIATPDGYYSINSVRGGLALDVSGCSSSDAAMIQTWNPTGADCQKWSIVQVSPGIYKVVSKLSGKVLDIQFGGNNDGAALQIYSYLGNAQQHFKFELLQSPGTVSWESYNFPTYIIRHQNGRGRIDQNVTPIEDGQWRMIPGLAGTGVSFQSVNFPGSYLRHTNGEIWSNNHEGSQGFCDDATFNIRAGLADATKVSFESNKYPGSYIRHRNYLLYSEGVAAGTGYSDATFNVYVPNVPPTVSLTAPANNATYVAAANITLTATASDSDGSINKVEFYNGTTLLGTSTTNPYSYNWTNVAAGTYTLTAKAYDNKNAVTTSSAITVKVNANQNPTVSITSPLNGATFTAPGVVNISATASDVDGTIAKVEFYNGATLLGTKTTIPYTFSWTNVPSGSYSITAKATDDKGGVSTSTIVTLLVNNAPNVSITAPANNATYVAAANITLTASATDTDGNINKVEFYNGTSLLGTSTIIPYSYSWTNVGVGTYSITAKAYDNFNFSTTSTVVTVKVNANQNPTVSVNATSTTANTVNITATANDADGNITKVDYYDGTTKIGTSTSSPYTYTYTGVSAGTHNITAVATDDKGGITTSSIVTVTVSNSNQAPTVSITAPANNANYVASANITLKATAADADGNISKVEFYNGITLLGTLTSTPYSYNWTNVGVGTYTVTAKAYDNLNMSATSTSITVTVNANQNPTVNITSPANNATFTSPATFNITATASDIDGTISKVEFYNGTILVGSSSSNPYTYNWMGVNAGTYQLTAKAIDDKGGVTTSSKVTVVVNNPNQSPTVTITSPANNTNYVAPGSTTFTAIANDPDGSISKVEYYNGSTLLGTTTVSPYSYNWTSIAAGTYTITAKAYDNLNFTTTSSPITINVTVNQSPVVTLVASSTSPNTVTLNVTATDSDGSITKVEYYDGTTKIGESTNLPYTFTSSNMLAGNHTVTAVAIDDKGGKTTSNPVTLIVSNPNQAPTVSIISPTNNSTLDEPARISISVNATDIDGGIAKVEFYNGNSKLGESASSPYTYDWNNVMSGNYVIKVVAVDDKGLSSEAVVNVVVTVPTATIGRSTFSELSIYPNPTQNVVNFSSEVKEVVIHTLSGTVVQKMELNGKSDIDLSNLNSGMYLLQLITDKQSTFIKVTKE